MIAHDDIIDGVIGELRALLTRKGDAPLDQHLRISALSGILDAMARSVKENRRESAERLYDEIFDERWLAPKRPTDPHAESRLLIQFGRILAFGWALRVQSAGDIRPIDAESAATSIINKVLRERDFPPGLADVYIAGIKRDLIARMQVDNWESMLHVPRNRREVATFWVDDGWPLRGLAALLLLSMREYPLDSSNPEVQRVVQTLPDLRDVMAKLKTTLVPSRFNDESSFDAHAAVWITPQQKWLAKQQADSLQRLVDEPISAAKVAELKSDVNSRWSTRDGLVKNFRSRGIPIGSDSTPSFTQAVQRGWNLPKEDLVDGFRAAAGLAEIIADDLSVAHDVQVMGRFEHRVMALHQTSASRGALVSAVTRMIDELKGEDLKPNVIFVPDPRIMGMWMLPDAKSTEVLRLHGQWSWNEKERWGCAVVPWAHSNPKSLIVCDVRRAFRISATAPHTVAVDVSRELRTDTTSTLLRARSAETLDAVPRFSELTVLGTVRVDPEIYVSDVNAARAIEIPAELLEELRNAEGED